MAFIKDFKEFAMKGNVIDMAVWVIIGWAFWKIVSSLVENVFMPIIGYLTAWVDVKDLTLKMPLLAIDGTSKMLELKYGLFLQSVIDFIIVAFCIFLFIRLIARISKKKKSDAVAEEKPSISEDVLLLREIRDLLKK